MSMVETMLRVPMPEEERTEFVREIAVRPWPGDKRVHFYNQDVPPSQDQRGYAVWNQLHLCKPGKRCDQTLDGKPCPGLQTYSGYYCTHPRCPKSIEAHDLVWAIKKNDLLGALRIASLVIGDQATLLNLAWMIDGIMTGGEYSRTKVHER